MSTINNVPFDINRTPTDTNKVKAKKGAVPVYSSEAIHQTPAHDPVSERRKRKDRRKKALNVLHDRRMLKQRRMKKKDQAKQAKLHKKPKGPGQFIDFKV